MKATSWDKVCEESKKKDIPPIQLMFFKLNRRYPTKRELRRFIKNVVMPTKNGIYKINPKRRKKFENVRNRFYRYLKNEEKGR